jgi:hypothetical protein
MATTIPRSPRKGGGRGAPASPADAAPPAAAEAVR